jgi:multidrug efflux pump subunit AcrA (membrane-fusion protein)
MSTETEKLEQLRAELALARKKHEERKTALDAARAAWEEANRALIESEQQLREDVKAADEAFREAALETYAIDPENKKPVDGIEVKLYDVMDFDKAEADTWARTNMPALLILDEKAYRKILKEVANNKALRNVPVLSTIPGTVRKEPKPNVDRDLSAYIPQEQPKAATTPFPGGTEADFDAWVDQQEA